MAKSDSSHLPEAISELVGRWTAADPWATSVSLIVSTMAGNLSIEAVDQSDGETAEIMNVNATGDEISFAAYWSSGQLTKYRLRRTSNDQLEAVFTVTATTTFKRSEK